MVKLSDREFEDAVQQAIDSIPSRFRAELENIAFFVEDEPSADDLRDGDGYLTEDGDMLGLYDGISLLERADGYGEMGDYPDSIIIFKGPHERLEGTKEEVLEEVRKTVIHEVAHYFGMDEDQVDAMGYA